MNKRLKEQLETRKRWLMNESVNYSKEEFKEEFKKFSDNIEESYYLDLISTNIYLQCKDTLYDYIKYILF